MFWENSRHARAIRSAPNVNGRVVPNLRGGADVPGRVHGEAQHVIGVKVEEPLFPCCGVHHHAKRSGGEHQVAPGVVSQIAAYVMRAVPMHELQFQGVIG